MAERLSFVLKQCQTYSPVYTKAVHSNAFKTGQLSNLHLATWILSAYGKCGDGITDACQLFDEISVLHKAIQASLDVVCWNAVISVFIQNRRDEMAFQYFKRMQLYFSSCGVQNSSYHKVFCPDSYTLSTLLSSNYCLDRSVIVGQQLHGHATKTGLLSSLSVGNALITFYATWDRIHDSRLIFEAMPRRNVVSWTALISGIARQHFHEEEALKAFVMMMSEEDQRQRPNKFTLASIFSLCGRLASLSQGIPFIPLALKLGLLSDINVQNSIVGFYSECGCLEEAKATFKSITSPDLISWNSLLKGYSQDGQGKEAVMVFKEMQTRGVAPDSITFLSVLSACKHSGMISQGLELLRAMNMDHGIEAQPEHISCVVDLLGRAGLLGEATEFIKETPYELSASVWRTLLGACRAYGQVEIAELAASKLLKFDDTDCEAYIVLSHIYGGRGEWNKFAEVRRLFKEKGGSKTQGFSCIELMNKVNSFVASDWSHPLINEIRETLRVLTDHMKEGDVEDCCFT